MSQTTPRAQYRAFLGQLALIAFALAFVLTAIVSALQFWNFRTVSFLGAPSIAVNLLVMGQVIPIVATLITVWRLRTRVAAGTIALPRAERSAGTRRLLPLPLWMRAIVLGIHGIVAAIAVCFAFWLASVDVMSFWPFVAFQGMFGGVLAAYAVVLTAHRLIAETAAERPPAERRHAQRGAESVHG